MQYENYEFSLGIVTLLVMMRKHLLASLSTNLILFSLHIVSFRSLSPISGLPPDSNFCLLKMAFKGCIHAITNIITGKYWRNSSKAMKNAL